MAKIIFHIDMDSFFVSCERSKNESLNNKPVVIASNSRRAIVTAMSYEVKNQGFKVGDPFYKIKDKIANLVVIEPHYELYSLMSKKIFKFIQDFFSSKIEIYSIDECYIDVTDEVKKFHSPIEMAKEIQNKILEIFKMPCSIGISYTKFLAKMSTNKAKPFGILETTKKDIKNNFYNLPVNKIFGVGKAIAPKLIHSNINTYEDLINCENDLLLRSIFGKNYYLFIKDLKGENTKEHILVSDIKSISNSKTFMSEDYDDLNVLLNELRAITINISQRAKDLNLEGKEIAVSIRNQERIWIHKSKKMAALTNDFDTLFKYVSSLFISMWDDNKIRGLGVALNTLVSIFDDNNSLDLFANQSKNLVEKIISENNFAIGKNTLKTLDQYKKEINENVENIKFLRKNTKSYNKKLNLEDEWE
ncbi:DNA polymerase IV (DinB) [Metamycoplasma auris 15026]|uniref:DNA polymerase IV (DinB) n=1 Tax=Metamycoplasma auris 15026 TaxID=1188233 RepID=N9V1Q2_9BACT|nr:DNA polymerase IV [Metamycoplasma auris]ENY69307.1 DNA polymerase IV (DinB) [Metamycoplasma auris 15026]